MLPAAQCLIQSSARSCLLGELSQQKSRLLGKQALLWGRGDQGGRIWASAILPMRWSNTLQHENQPHSPPSTTGLCNRSQHLIKQQEIHSANWHLCAQTGAVLEDPAGTAGLRRHEFAPCASPLELQLRWMEPCLQTQPMHFPSLKFQPHSPHPTQQQTKCSQLRLFLSPPHP